jgi:type I restriction enzyme M protein
VIRELLRGLPGTLVRDRGGFERLLDAAAKESGVKLPAPARKAILAALAALAERDETAAICRDRDGHPEPDPELRDTESVPLPAGGDPADAEGVPAGVRAFFAREVQPHVPDAWIDTARRDPRDGKVGLVGYEINFNRYFYRYTPPRPLEEIEADIRAIEQEILRMLAEVTGGAG